MQIAGRTVKADGQGPDGCLALFLDQGSLQNTAARVGHTQRWDSAIFPSEIHVFPSTENQRERRIFSVRLVPILSSLAQFMLLCTPRQRRKGQDIWGISTHQCCRHLFRVQSKSSRSGGPVQECVTAAAWPSMASPRLWQFSTSWATTTPCHQQSHRVFIY